MDFEPYSHIYMKRVDPLPRPTSIMEFCTPYTMELNFGSGIQDSDRPDRLDLTRVLERGTHKV